MRHKFLVLTVKKWLKLMYIYRSYRKIKTGVSLFGPLCIYTFYLLTYLRLVSENYQVVNCLKHMRKRK